MTPKTIIKAVALLVIILWAGSSITKHLYAAKAYYWTSPIADGVLQSDYAIFNSTWFENKLPGNVEVRYEATPNPNAMGLTDYEGYGTGTGHFVIWVDPKYHAHNVTAARETLMHEMCHISTWEQDPPDNVHGEHWTACMVKLANDGAFKDVW
jgi:hypothetical protein